MTAGLEQRADSRDVARAAAPCLDRSAHGTAPTRVARGGPAQGWLLASAVAGLALLLRTQHLSDISFWFDESCSLKISQFPWVDLRDAVARDAHPPLYYVLLRIWGAVGDHSPAWIRGLSVVFGLATVGAAAWFMRLALADVTTARGACDRERWEFAAFLAAGLLATSGLHIALSLEARPYTLGTFLAVISACFLLRALRPAGALSDWVLFTLAALLLSLTHYYGLLTVAAEFVLAVSVLVRDVWRSRGSRPAWLRLAAAASSAWVIQFVWLWWLPVFEFQRARANAQLWMSDLDGWQLAAMCAQALTGAPGGSEAWAVAAVAVWALTVGGLLIQQEPAARLVALCTGLPLLAAVAYSLAVRNILGVRYLIFAHVFLVLGWALLIAQCRWRAVRFGLAGAVLVWTAFWCWRYSERRAFLAGFPGTRGAAAYLDQVRGSGERVIVSSPFVHPTLQHYCADRSALYARYDGDHRMDLLGGPPLQAAECITTREVSAITDSRVWTVDVAGLFGRLFETRVPDTYRRISERRFPERNGHRMDILVREYVREQPVPLLNVVAGGSPGN